jgi:hypothetical protein
VAHMLSIFEVEDYGTWKERFDSDPVGRKQAAKKLRLFRGAENPNRVYISLEFASQDEAKAFREKLLASGMLDTMKVVSEPTVAELEEEVEY